jgi:hypothetical protein
MTQEKYWTYERDGEISDIEALTKDDAQECAEDIFAEECEVYENGYQAEMDITLIEFMYDDEGERVILQRIPSGVSYEEYHGDFKEHNTYHRGGKL